MAVRGPQVVVKFLGDASNLNAAVAASSTALGGLGAAAVAGGALAAGAIGALGVFSLKSFADFDQAMTQSTAIMGDLTENQITALEDAARQMGLTTTFSATEAAESIFFLASAGLDAEQSIAALPAVAQFAQAGMFDMATATDLATDAQSAMGLTVDDSSENLENLTRVTDVLVGANTLANASVEQFSAALTNKAGPAMRALNVPLEEGVAVLAAMADQGIKGAEAGTQLSMMLRNMTTKAVENSDTFDRLGVAVFDADGNMNNIADIVGDLEGLLGGMSEETKKATLLQLGFGDKAQATIFALLGTSDAIAGYNAELTDMGGITEEVANKQLESFKSQMNLLKSRFVDLGITIGSKMAPKILEAIDLIERKWAEWGPTIRQFISQARDAFVIIVAHIRAFVAEFRERTAEGSELGDKLRVKFEEIRETVERVFAHIQEIIATVVEVIQVIWERWGDDIVAFLEESVSALLKIWEGAWQTIKGIFDLIAGILTGDWGRIWDGVTAIVDGAFDMLIGMWDLFFARVRLFATIIWDILHDLFDGPFTWVGEQAEAMYNAVVDWFGDLFTAIGDFATDAWNAAKDVGSAIMNGIVDGISGAVGFVTDFVTGLGNAIVDMLNDQVISRINDGIPDKISIPFAPDINLPDNPLPTIPRFATGAFVSSPTLAVVGDTPGEGEFVAPESKLKAAVQEAMASQGGGGVNIGTINMNTKASPKDLADELGWAILTGGI